MESTPIPLSPAQLFDRLDALGIAHHTVDHPPLYTVEQSKRLRGDLPGAHTKNLFLRNKRGRMWLVTCLEERRFDLKSFRPHLQTKTLSFCSAERLMRYLGVGPGAVTPFAVVNDVDGEVQVILDAAVLQMEPLNFHPLDNSRTTSVSAGDLLKFLEAVEHPPVLLDFDRLADAASQKETG